MGRAGAGPVVGRRVGGQAGTVARVTSTSPLPVRPRTCSATASSGGAESTLRSLRARPEPEREVQLGPHARVHRHPQLARAGGEVEAPRARVVDAHLAGAGAHAEVARHLAERHVAAARLDLGGPARRGEPDRARAGAQPRPARHLAEHQVAGAGGHVGVAVDGGHVHLARAGAHRGPARPAGHDHVARAGAGGEAGARGRGHRDHERHHSQRQVLRRAHDQPPPGLRPGDLGGPHGLRGEVGGLGARPGRRLADPAEHTADALAPHAARGRVVAHLDLHLRLVGPVEVHLDAPDVDRELQLGDAAHRPALPAHELVVDPGVGAAGRVVLGEVDRLAHPCTHPFTRLPSLPSRPRPSRRPGLPCWWPASAPCTACATQELSDMPWFAAACSAWFLICSTSRSVTREMSPASPPRPPKPAKPRGPKPANGDRRTPAPARRRCRRECSPRRGRRARRGAPPPRGRRALR